MSNVTHEHEILRSPGYPQDDISRLIVINEVEGANVSLFGASVHLSSFSRSGDLIERNGHNMSVSNEHVEISVSSMVERTTDDADASPDVTHTVIHTVTNPSSDDIF